MIYVSVRGWRIIYHRGGKTLSQELIRVLIQLRRFFALFRWLTFNGSRWGDSWGGGSIKRGKKENGKEGSEKRELFSQSEEMVDVSPLFVNEEVSKRSFETRYARNIFSLSLSVPRVTDLPFLFLHSSACRRAQKARRLCTKRRKETVDGTAEKVRERG